MKNLFLFALFFFASSAHADTIKCSFTEPFLDVVYDMSEQSLTVIDAGEKAIRDKSYHVAFQIKGPAEFALVDKDKNVLMTLSLDFKGSDGMSDVEYPYSANWVVAKNQNSLFGGCTSDLLKAKNEQ